MRKRLLSAALLLGVTSCSQHAPQTCSRTVDLPSATVWIGQHDATVSLKTGVARASYAWTWRGGRGADTLDSGLLRSDTINVGCAEGLEIEER